MAEKKEPSGFQSPMIIIGTYVPPPQQMTGVALMSQFFFIDSMNCDEMTYLPAFWKYFHI